MNLKAPRKATGKAMSEAATELRNEADLAALARVTEALIEEEEEQEELDKAIEEQEEVGMDDIARKIAESRESRVAIEKKRFTVVISDAKLSESERAAALQTHNDALARIEIDLGAERRRMETVLQKKLKARRRGEVYIETAADTAEDMSVRHERERADLIVKLDREDREDRENLDMELEGADTATVDRRNSTLAQRMAGRRDRRLAALNRWGGVSLYQLHFSYYTVSLHFGQKKTRDKSLIWFPGFFRRSEALLLQSCHPLALTLQATGERALVQHRSRPG